MKQLLFCCLVITMGHAMAQQAKTPAWITETVEGENYYYYKGVGENTSKPLAKNDAINDVIIQIARQEGIDVTVKSSSKTGYKQVQRNNRTDNSSTFDHQSSVEELAKRIGIKNLTEVEHFVRKESSNLYEYHVLVRIPKGSVDPKLPVYEKHVAAPVLRSAIVPGWGQLYKKEKKKGWAIMATEGALLSGVAVSQIMHNLNYNKATETRNIQSRMTFYDNADSWATIRNVTAIGAGVVYIYAVIDAATSKGLGKFSHNSKLRFSPIVMTNGAGLYVSFRLN